MGVRRQTGKQTSRDFDMVTPKALPEPSVPPFSANATLLSSARLFGSLWGLILYTGRSLVLALNSGASRC